MGIFRMVSKEVAQCLNYLYPDYDKNISNYVIRQKKKISKIKTFLTFDDKIIGYQNYKEGNKLQFIG